MNANETYYDEPFTFHTCIKLAGIWTPDMDTKLYASCLRKTGENKIQLPYSCKFKTWIHTIPRTQKETPKILQVSWKTLSHATF